MLRRLTLGLFILACVAVAACSSGNTTIPSSGGVPGLGPNMATNTIYLTDTTQNAVYLYTPSPGPSASPIYQIGGLNTTMSGPSYLAFDSSKRLYVTNYSPATKAASILVFMTYATGDVVPYGTISLPAGIQPRGIAMRPNDAGFAVAFNAPGGFFPSFINLYSALVNQRSFVTNTIAGGNTKLDNPIGVGVDANGIVYAANSGNATITTYVVPSPSPTPSNTPSPTPSPTPTPSGSPSSSPNPTPTPASLNIAPAATITCVPAAGMPSPCMAHPTGLALDSSGNVYVTDPDSGASPGVYVFSSAQVACGAPPCSLGLTPSSFISGSNTKLSNPTDVAVDSSGTIYVIDAGTGPNTSMLLIFAPGANGNVAPQTAIALPPGNATGIALSP